MNDPEDPFFIDPSVRPSTDHIFTIQAPYGHTHGITPPPEDFDTLLRETYPLGYHVTDPPTPPRTEGVSSPSARSSLSGRSPSSKADLYATHGRLSPDTTYPTSPASDAAALDETGHGTVHEVEDADESTLAEVVEDFDAVFFLADVEAAVLLEISRFFHRAGGEEYWRQPAA